MRRREFIGLVGGATAWPMAARAQQPERMRRIGALMTLAANDKRGQTFVAAFVERLQQLGWADGRNAKIDTRWGAGDVDLIRKYAGQLVALGPDVVWALQSNGKNPSWI